MYGEMTVDDAINVDVLARSDPDAVSETAFAT